MIIKDRIVNLKNVLFVYRHNFRQYGVKPEYYLLIDSISENQQYKFDFEDEEIRDKLFLEIANKIDEMESRK